MKFGLHYWWIAIKYKVCRGYGGFGALGHSVYHRELLPRLVEGVSSEKICHIATSGAHSAAITESGIVIISSVYFNGLNFHFFMPY